MCQACVNNGDLTQKTLDKINTFLNEWPNAEFGPGHIVFSDSNILDEHIDFCLEEAEKERINSEEDEELFATINFLNELRLVPEKER